MAPGNNCRRIVRTISGSSTGGDDDIFVCDDGSRWRRIHYVEQSATAPNERGYLHKGHVCDHE